MTTNVNRRIVQKDKQPSTRDENLLLGKIQAWLKDNYERYSKFILSSINQEETILYDDNVSLFTPKMILFLDELFNQTELCLDFKLFLKSASAEKLDIWEGLDDRLGEICLYAEKAYIYLLAIETDPKIDIALVKRRIMSIRNKNVYTYSFLERIKAEKVLAEQLLSVDDAFALYHSTKIQRKEMILAGGDATRFLKMVMVLLQLANEAKVLREEDIFMIKYTHAYKDISHLFSFSAFKEVLMTPIFQYIGCSSKDVARAFEGGVFNLESLKPYIEKVATTFKPGVVPKAMNIVYKCVGEGSVLYLSFLTASIIRIYAEILREDSFGSELIYVVKNKKQVEAFTEPIDYLYSRGGFDKKRLLVRFVETTKAALPLSDYHKGLVFDDDDILTSSPGHGPAFMKIINEELTNNSSGVTISLRTVDNSGAHVTNYVALVQKAVVFEHEMRMELVEALNGSKKKTAAFFRQLGIFCETNMKERIAEYVKKRWDVVIDTKNDYKEIAKSLSEMPMSVALVISGQESKGGGLYVLDSGHLVIIDNGKSEEQREIKKFNPMIFATYINKKLEEDFDRECLFVTTKGDAKTTYYQAESASTHIATCPGKTLKRFINFNRNDVSEVFIQQKTIEESSEEKNKAFTTQLIQDIEFICNEVGVDREELVVSIHMLQKEFLSKF